MSENLLVTIGLPLAGALPAIIAAVVSHQKTKNKEIANRTFLFRDRDQWTKTCLALDDVNLTYRSGFKYPYYFLTVESQWIPKGAEPSP